MADKRTRHRSRSRSSSPRRRRRSRSTESRTPSPQLAHGRGRYDDRKNNKYDYVDGDDPEEVGYRVHIGDIVKRTTREQLEERFGKFGRIKEVFIANTFPQFAIVSFDDKLDAEDAIREMDGNYFNESKISVSFARPRTRPRGIRKPPSSASCYKCGRTGHFARECERDPDDYVRDDHGRDYHRRDGRDRYRDRGDRDGYRDRRPDRHFSSRGRGGGGSRSISCYTCGRPGHFARDCMRSGNYDRRRRSRSYSSSPDRRRRSRSRSISPVYKRSRKDSQHSINGDKVEKIKEREPRSASFD